MDNLETFINLTIILLLLPTLVYAYKLNKSLSALRQNQSSLATLIKSLNEATKKAENSIPKLKSFTEHSSSDLKNVVDSAKILKDDLMFINQRADGLADRLEGIIHVNRAPNEEKSKEPNKQEEKKETTTEDARSLAEMELLKALRSIK